jgi:hypothetical protein
MSDSHRMKPSLRAKSRIVVLRNHEDRIWKKSEKFAPILCPDSLCFLTSMAVASRRPLRQGDCKNTFCQGILLPDEITIVRPPSGDPKAAPDKYWLLKCTLYSLRHSPRHWYDKINAILCSIGLTPLLKDPCLYIGFIRDPSNPSAPPSLSPLSLGLYVDDFVYFSEDPEFEELFCRLLSERCKVDLWGLLNGFLEFTSAGGSRLPSLTSILTNPALPLISSKVLIFRHEPRLLQLPHIVLGYPLIRSLLLRMRTVPWLKFVVEELSRALSAALAG